MVPESEVQTPFPVDTFQGARVTELQVRMDCTGCVHKIKRALHAVEGVYEVLFNLPEQKLTVVGRADPELIVTAIRKIRKAVTVSSSSHVEAEAVPPETPAPEEPCLAASVEGTPPAEPEGKEVVEFPMTHYYPRGRSCREARWSSGCHDRPYCVVSHGYSTCGPPGTVSEYAYDGWRAASPPAESFPAGRYYHYAMDVYEQRWRTAAGGGGGGGGGGDFAAFFSDENPNACVIV